MQRNPDEQGESTTTDEEELEKLRAELEEANRKGEDHFRLLQRVQADFTNYKRRVDQERSDFARATKADTILKILPAIDDLGRALEMVPEEIASQEWSKGIALIHRKLLSALESEGLKRIEARGKEFDPWEHEAVLHQETRDIEPGKVLMVLREGYKLDDKVIRPAQVIVAKEPSGH